MKSGLNFHPTPSTKCAPHLQNADLPPSTLKVRSGYSAAVSRARCACKLVNKETNVLLLDEPTNHLDVDAKDALKEALKEYRGSVLLICHEPEFYQDVVSQVWDCSKWTTKVL